MVRALRGRDGKQVILDRLLSEVRGRQPGAGAARCRVIRVAGVESEMELTFAVRHQLCAPRLNSLERLPGPPSDTLRTAFGLGPGAAPDRCTVSLAVLGLLSEAAQDQPLVCVTDDAHRGPVGTSGTRGHRLERR